MEREQKITKLINVLRRTAWSLEGNPDAEVVDQAAEQFNRILQSLSGLDDEVSTIFAPLKQDSSAAAVQMACRQLAAYFRDEIRATDTIFDPESFREFWKKSAQDLEEIGEFVRESIEKMQEKKRKHETPSNGSEQE